MAERIGPDSSEMQFVSGKVSPDGWRDADVYTDGTLYHVYLSRTYHDSDGIENIEVVAYGNTQSVGPVSIAVRLWLEEGIFSHVLDNREGTE